MKAKYNLTVTFLGEDGSVKTDTFDKAIFDYVSNGQYLFVQENDENESENVINNKIHWYPLSRILRIDGIFTRTFETKSERLDYFKQKNGIKAKGVKN